MVEIRFVDAESEIIWDPMSMYEALIFVRT